jgi:hypothetical protein
VPLGVSILIMHLACLLDSEDVLAVADCSGCGLATARRSCRCSIFVYDARFVTVNMTGQSRYVCTHISHVTYSSILKMEAAGTMS